METCYAHKQPFEHPWLLSTPPKGGASEGKP
jgi:hypothetical protein